MRTLATLATLLLGLVTTAALVVTVIGPLHAGHDGGGTGHGGGGGGITLGDLSCTTDQIARYDGANWVCSTGALTCSSGQLAKFNGADWVCAADEDTLADLPSCMDGDIAKFDGDVWNCESGGPRTVFVTLGRENAGIYRALASGVARTGLIGADEICRDEAENGVVPPGHYIAWLSTSAKDAKDRLPPNTGGYFLPSGVKVADDKTDLIDSTLDHPIDETASGDLVPLDTPEVWTGTDGGGMATAETCTDWSPDGLVNGTFGDVTQSGEGWTNAGTAPCGGLSARLYCFQR